MHIRKTITILAALAAVAGCGTRKYCNTVKIDGDDANTIIEKAANVVPTANQLAALDREFIAFIHFGPNTFTGKEWGSGFSPPKLSRWKPSILTNGARRSRKPE